MTIVVTGASGVVGSHLIRHFVSLGAAVVGCDVVPPRREGAGNGRYRFMRGDVRDIAFLLQVLKETRAAGVVHLAGMLGEACAYWPGEALEVNVKGTLNVFEAARLSSVRRVVFASTRTVLPDFTGTRFGYPTHAPVTEDVAPSPRRPYEVMKYANEQLGRFYRERHGLETVALRFSMMFSPERARLLAAGPEADTAGFTGRSAAPLHRMIWTAAFGGRTEVEGGERLLDLTYVKDIVRGIALACTAPGPPAPLYHLGSGRLCSVADLARTLLALSPAADIRVSPGLDFGVGHFCLLSIRLASEELGYRPAFTLESGMRDCIEELRRPSASGDR